MKTLIAVPCMDVIEADFVECLTNLVSRYTPDEVEVKYEGKLVNGTIFDSSYQRNPQTTKFKPTQVIKGWTEALTMMPEGSIWELYIPQNLAYGERGAGEIPPFSTLIFKVEVVKVNKKQEATK